MNSIIGIDFGVKKTGFAYAIGTFCFAWKTIPTAKIFPEISKMIAEKTPEKIIIWMPYNIDGSLSVHARRVQIFAKKLAKNTDIPIILHDERLTTSEARLGFCEYNYSGDVDAEAARLILESFLESAK